MKRIITLLLSAVMIMSLAACGETGPTGSASEQTQATEATEVTEVTEATEATAPADPDVPVSDDPQLAYGKNGCVVAADPAAAQVGIDILKAGGNAMDAAIATAYALGVAENAASGIGGGGMLLYYDASSKKTTSINYNFECPKGLVLDDFKDAGTKKENGQGGITAVVPGFVAGMDKANQMFGTMPMADLIAPSIKLAEEGVPVTAFMAENYRDYFEKMLLYPETLRVFTNEGFPYGEGDIFKNPDMAKTLKIIAEKGPDGFYKGELAEAIVSSQRATGSRLTISDLENYHVEVYEPVMTTYRGYKIAAAPAPSGGSVIASILNMAEHFDISGMEFGSLEYVHTWGEIFHVAMADYGHYIEDPDFYDMAAVRGMATKEYAAERVKLVSPTSTIEQGTWGDPAGYDAESHTTHLSVIDKDGNMVSMTNSNTDFFGTLTTVTDYGFVIANTSAFTAGITSYLPEAGKRTRSPMTPTLLFDPDGNPIAALGTPGSMRILTTISLLISDIVDYDMDIKTAMDSPRLFQTKTGNLELEGGLDPALEDGLKKLGHELTWHVTADYFFGGAHCISLDPETGLLTGSADIRRSGVAMAY